MNMNNYCIATVFLLVIASCTHGKNMNNNTGPQNNDPKIQTRSVEYQHGDRTLKGYLAHPENPGGKRPGILICHEWTGLSDYEKMRARQLAGAGYIVLSADIYGKNLRPESHEEAAEASGRFRKNRPLFRKRVQKGLDVLKNQPNVNKDKLAAIGYCFGGTAVLELARSGSDISGVVSFHGGLSNPNPESAANIQTGILVLHGASDPHVEMDQVNNFMNRMKKHDVSDWQVVVYGNTYHSFTNPESGSDPSGGSAYNERSARRAWQDMMQFFEERF